MWVLIRNDYYTENQFDYFQREKTDIVLCKAKESFHEVLISYPDHIGYKDFWLASIKIYLYTAYRVTKRIQGKIIIESNFK